MTATTNTGLGARSLAPAICVVALTFALSACAQSTATNGGLTAVNAPATTDPVLLSGATYTEADPTTTSSVSVASPSTADIVPAAGKQPTPVILASPVPPPAPTAASQPPATETAEAQTTTRPVTTAEEYPNVNIAPRQPDGKLLSPEERAKLIAELNALADRQTGGQ